MSAKEIEWVNWGIITSGMIDDVAIVNAFDGAALEKALRRSRAVR